MMNPITALINLFWDDNDRSLARQEIARRNRQEAKLTYLAEHGDLPPAGERVDTLQMGANVARRPEVTTQVVNTPYSDMAAKYGFETHKHHLRGELILFDTRFELLDADKRMVVVAIETLAQMNEGSLRRYFSQQRTYINRKAQRAGLLAVRNRPGNPGKVESGVM